MTLSELKTKKFSIVAHGAGSGSTQELRDWLVRLKIRELVYITFPFDVVPQKEVAVEVYREGRLVRTVRSLVRFKNPAILSFLKDFFYALLYIARFCGNSDILVASDNLLALAAVLSRRASRLKKIVCCMIDYTPVRYGFKPLNEFYYWLDRAACYGSDIVWPINERTIGGRFEDKRLDPKKVKWYAVPYGNHSSRITLPAKVRHDHICYMGGLLKNKGAELFIPIAEELLRRKKKFKFVIIGGGSYGEELREEIKKRKLTKQIEVLGYIRDNGRMQDIISRCGVALAPYYPEDRNNFSYYADAGKLKTYLGCGLPVVLTDVPPFAKTVAKRGAGLLAKYDPSDIADKIDRVIARQSAFRKKAIALGREYDWDLVLTRAIAGL